jgi:hypothetical protein
MEHIDWVNPDNIIIANSSNDVSYKRMTTDVQSNGVSIIRHLRIRVSKNTHKSYFRYVVNKQPTWFYISNDQTRNGDYFTFIYIIEEDEVNKLNSLYKKFDREDKINQLLK